MTGVDPRHADPDASEWIGTVVEGEVDFVGRAWIDVDFGDRIETITLARVIAPVCGPGRRPVVADLLPRLNALLPPGSAVRVVRATSGDPAQPLLLSDSGYIYAATSPASDRAATAPPATATVNTTPQQQEPAVASETITSADPAAVSDGPLPGSVNEVLLAEGLVKMRDPYIDLSSTADRSIDEQIVNRPGRGGGS
ncbi:hypothetical protein ACWDUD_28035 [Rhodococcus sp. NPDC003382]